MENNKIEENKVLTESIQNHFKINLSKKFRKDKKIKRILRYGKRTSRHRKNYTAVIVSAPVTIYSISTMDCYLKLFDSISLNLNKNIERYIRRITGSHKYRWYKNSFYYHDLSFGVNYTTNSNCFGDDIFTDGYTFYISLIIDLPYYYNNTRINNIRWDLKLKLKSKLNMKLSLAEISIIPDRVQREKALRRYMSDD